MDLDRLDLPVPCLAMVLLTAVLLTIIDADRTVAGPVLFAAIASSAAQVMFPGGICTLSALPRTDLSKGRRLGPASFPL